MAAKLSPAHIALGKAIRAIRDEQGIAQDELAWRAGLHRTYTGDIERGERNLGYANLLRIAKALGIRGSELLARAEKHRGHNKLDYHHRTGADNTPS